MHFKNNRLFVNPISDPIHTVQKNIVTADQKQFADIASG